MRKLISVVLLALLALQVSVANAQPVVCEQAVTVQADDWLSRIAEKVYGDVSAYPAIVEATRLKHAEDDSFANIENPDVIEVGWKLCLPSADDAELLIATAQAAPVVEVSPAEPTGIEVGTLVLATTTSTYDSGLLQAILPDFETRYGATVEVVAVGTGQALELGRNGDADVVLVHARNLEDEFVNEGFGVNRQDVMYNDFVIVGPADDPAGVAGMTDVAAALTQIAESESPYVSRGDNSGTHNKEQGLWAETNLDLSEDASGYTRPQGEWYQSVGQGMGATLTFANETQSYTLSDRATYLARSQEGLDLEILVQGDSRLFNPYGVIAVNPEVHPDVNQEGAALFIDWLTDVETQQRISTYGQGDFGQALFTPDSEAWNAAR